MPILDGIIADCWRCTLGLDAIGKEWECDCKRIYFEKIFANGWSSDHSENHYPEDVPLATPAESGVRVGALRHGVEGSTSRAGDPVFLVSRMGNLDRITPLDPVPFWYYATSDGTPVFDLTCITADAGLPDR